MKASKPLHHHCNRRISCHFISFPAIEETLVPSELVESFTFFPDTRHEMLLVNSESMPSLASEGNDMDVADGVIESRDLIGTWGRLRGLTSETSSLLSSK